MHSCLAPSAFSKFPGCNQHLPAPSLPSDSANVVGVATQCNRHTMCVPPSLRHPILCCTEVIAGTSFNVYPPFADFLSTGTHAHTHAHAGTVAHSHKMIMFAIPLQPLPITFLIHTQCLQSASANRQEGRVGWKNVWGFSFFSVPALPTADRPVPAKHAWAVKILKTTNMHSPVLVKWCPLK